MFSKYSILLKGETDTCLLTYNIKSHSSAQIWAALMKQCGPVSLRETLNPWQNFDSSIINKKIERLECLIDDLNSWLPTEKRILKKWNHNDHQESVNRLHVHFPEQEKTEKDKDRKKQLSEYNDLIHEIEELSLRPDQKRSYLLVCPDGIEEVPIMDYSQFRAQRHFGELCLHYCHVGRHPFELYSAWDIHCPTDQIIPQHAINTYHTLRFYDDPCLEHWHKQKFKNFYDKSTLKNKIDFKDPKIAFGYISIGNLEKVNESTQYTKPEVYTLVNKCNRIVEWYIE